METNHLEVYSIWIVVETISNVAKLCDSIWPTRSCEEPLVSRGPTSTGRVLLFLPTVQGEEAISNFGWQSQSHVHIVCVYFD